MKLRQRRWLTMALAGLSSLLVLSVCEMLLFPDGGGVLAMALELIFPPANPLPRSAPEPLEFRNYYFDQPYSAHLPRGKRAAPVVASATTLPTFRESRPPAYTGECHAGYKGWEVNDPPWCRTSALRKALLPSSSSSSFRGHGGIDLQLPRYTTHGEPTADFFQRLLRQAWGSAATTPTVDLYVRAGCRGKAELDLLWETVYLFWPNFLGEIILVLDRNDHVEDLVPQKIVESFSLHVVYEHVPSFRARIFNQYSYLNAYRHSSADYLVTIDSDCAFHRPVTPDVLFDAEGKLLLPTSRTFQYWLWSATQHKFTKKSDAQVGHSMVSQPVSFARQSMPRFFEFINRTRGTCYEHLLAVYDAGTADLLPFCWMCQLSTYIAAAQEEGEGEGEEKEYNVFVTDAHEDDAYVRVASHFSYEYYRSKSRAEESVTQAVLQGICYWFPQEFEVACTAAAQEEEKGFAYLERLLFVYAGFDLSQTARPSVKHSKLRGIRSRLQHLVRQDKDEDGILLGLVVAQQRNVSSVVWDTFANREVFDPAGGGGDEACLLRALFEADPHAPWYMRAAAEDSIDSKALRRTLRTMQQQPFTEEDVFMWLYPVKGGGKADRRLDAYVLSNALMRKLYPKLMASPLQKPAAMMTPATIEQLVRKITSNYGKKV